MDFKELEEENKKLKQIIQNIDMYQEQKLRRTFGTIENEEVIALAKDKLMTSPVLREKIFNALGRDFINDDFTFSILIHGTLIGNYLFSFNMYNKPEEEISKDELFINSLASNAAMQIILLSEAYESMPYSRIFYSPIISALYSISDLIEKRIINHVDDQNIINKHQSKIILNLLPYISEAINSLESTIVLFTRKSYTQAAIAMRTLIEQFIIIATLAHYPNTIEKFLFHNELKVKEELDPRKFRKEIDEYLISQEINPENLTLRSKYIDYGWMDQIEEFKSDKSKKMYKPKTMARLIGLDNYYEWYADLSNYVHSNFLYLKIDWNKFLNVQIGRLADIVLKFLDLYKWLTNYDFIYKNIDILNYLNDLTKAFNILMNKTNYSFDLSK